MMGYIEDFFAFFGKPFFFLLDMLGRLGDFVLFNLKLIPLYFKKPYRIKEMLQQVEIIGVGSIGVIALTGTFTGLVEAVQLYQGFHKFGAENMMGYTIFISITKELGPVFAGLMLTSRAISAMAAELGTMRVTEQIDALETLAVNSRSYLLIPRILATTLSLPLLVGIFDFAGNLSAYLISTKALGVNSTEYVNTIHMYLSYSEIYSGLLKGAVFGFTIGSIGSYIGYFTTGGARGVGRSTTNAVVYSAIMVFVLDYFLSSLFLVLDW